MSKTDSPDTGRNQPDIFAPAAGLAAPSALGGQATPLAAVADQQAPERLPASFESALSELEALVARMESGELTLEQSLSAYKRGATLLQYCQAALNDAQQQVKMLEAGVLKDFSSANDDGQ
jgi:exodeoxyribonuclease VII small subunit